MAKESKVRFIHSRGFLLLMILFIFVLLLTFFFGDGGIIEIISAQRKIDTLKQSIEDLREEKAFLTKEIEELENNPATLEKRAREKLWLMKKNEKVVVVVSAGSGQ